MSAEAGTAFEQTPQAPQNADRFRGWRMVALGSAAQNLAIGTVFGGFGVLIKPITEEFATNRSTAALGIAIVTLVMGLASPPLGRALDRYSIKRIMMLGAAIMAAGMYAAAQATSIYLFLVYYGLVVGLGSTLLGTLPSATLVTNWFIDKRGLAIGIVNIPLLVAIMPIVVTYLNDNFTWRGALIAIALGVAAFIPLLLVVIDRPSDIKQQPLGSTDQEPQQTDNGEVVATAGDLSQKDLLRNPQYWFLIVFVGMVISGGIVLITHLFAFATDNGISVEKAAVLLSLNGASAMVGALLFGWLADKMGGYKVLAIIAGTQVLLWLSLLYAPNFLTMLGSIAIIGACGGGAYPCFSTLVAQQFGANHFGTAMGLAALLMLPFSFLSAPLSGYLYDIFGSYVVAFSLHIVLFACATVFFFIKSIRRRT